MRLFGYKLTLPRIVGLLAAWFILVAVFQTTKPLPPGLAVTGQGPMLNFCLT